MKADQPSDLEGLLPDEYSGTPDTGLTMTYQDSLTVEEHQRSEDVPLLLRNNSQESVRSDWMTYAQEKKPIRTTQWLKTVLSVCSRHYRRCICGCAIVSVLLFILFALFSAFYFSPAAIPPSTLADKSANSTARLLTLNIFMRPPGIKNNWSDYKEERLKYIIRYVLPQYDVVTLQEAFAFANRRVDHLIESAQALGFNHHVASPRHYPWELAGDGGLLLLSRFPIAKAFRLEFPRGVHSDWFAYKGALYAKIELDSNHSLHLYTSHTQASYDFGGKLNEKDTEVRLSQFARVHQLMYETAKDDNLPILLMGDLNVDATVHDNASTVNASSQPYHMMMQVLRGDGIQDKNSEDFLVKYDHPWRLEDLSDVAYQEYGRHPVTFGDIITANGVAQPAETVLTHPDQLMTKQSIDRMLWASRNSSTIRLTNVTVEKFMVKDNDQLTEDERSKLPFTQVSGKEK
ncbi:hypothetical protein EC973_005744 [Apophysomyces ossiformis]|uniref:Endonuclease/exonuclease/phosphatase domain-containing protein n=1 Tax=Apophysomyces ossiformis TaxID=679940 RepID=A0A8H7EPB7_9FUNG|nr:hypothetical protein EC973_005744 [Apophysomyces ossiformis]